MRTILTLILALGLCACSGGSGSTMTADEGNNPLPPLNRDDGQVFHPPEPGGPDGGDEGPIDDFDPQGNSIDDPNGGLGDDQGGDRGSNPPAPVPEPGTMVLVGSGLASLAWYRRRQRKD